MSVIWDNLKTVKRWVLITGFTGDERVCIFSPKRDAKEVQYMPHDLFRELGNV